MPRFSAFAVTTILGLSTILSFQNCSQFKVNPVDLSTPPSSLNTRETNFVSQQPQTQANLLSEDSVNQSQTSTPACAYPALTINQITAQNSSLWNNDKEKMKAHCAAIGLPVPSGTQLQGLFTYQGGYQRIAADADELVCRLARFKAVYLTHAFTVLNEKSAFSPQQGSSCAPRQASGNSFEVTDPYLILKNGRYQSYDNDSALDGAYFDQYGRGLFYVISKLRHLHSTDIQIYGYVATTIDNPNGIWSNLAQAQNYLCPNGICTDFMAYINKWRSLEKTYANSWIDGFFVDMTNEFYVNKASYANQVSYIQSLRSDATNLPYKISVNTLATGASFFYPAGDANATVVSSSKRPIPWAAEYLRAGDSVFVEGFVYKAGKPVSDLAEIGQELQALPDGVHWSAVGSETTFIPALFISEYDTHRQQVANSVYGNLGGLSLDQAYASYLAHQQRLSDLNSGTYFRAKTVNDMARYLVDYNFMIGADQASGGTSTPDSLCQYVVSKLGSISGTSNTVTAQEAGYSCLSSARAVNCTSDNWKQIAYNFNTWKGENLLYHEGGLGTYSGQYAAGCFWSNPQFK